MEGLCCMFLPLLRSFPLLVPFSVLYGYFDGAYVALIPVVTSDTVGSTHLASALGVVYFLHAIPYLVSPPIGGKSYSVIVVCMYAVENTWVDLAPPPRRSSSSELQFPNF